jgi:hypothetical protein
MRLVTFLLISTGLIWLAGCGKDNTVKEIIQLRSEGQLTAARDRTIDALQETPDNFDLWLEFARVSADLARESERADGAQTMDYLAEGGLVCAAVYKFKDQKPNREWRDACRLISAEVTKQANKLQTQMTAQAQSAEYLGQLLSMDRGDQGQSGARVSAARMVEDYRSNARSLLFREIVIKRFLEMLPEVTTGSSTMFMTQIANAELDWTRSLQLTSDLITPIQERANREVDVALERVMGDLTTLGYMIPGTILEHGIHE